MSERLKQQLLRHEGLRLKPYRDTVGKLTIGVGRNLDDRGITEAEAYYLLDHDIMWVRNEVENTFPVYAELNTARQDVILNMAFNMGVPKLRGFVKMWLALERGNFTRAAEEMLESRWAEQVKGRAKELAEQMDTGWYDVGGGQ